MTVVFDLLGFQSRDHGERGIARYVLQLGLALERTRPGLVTEYLAHPELPFPEGAEPLLATGRVVRRDRDRAGRRPSTPGVFVAGSPFETFHLSSECVFPPATRGPAWRTAAVVHDLIPAMYPDWYLKRAVDRYRYQARVTALRSADHLLANSRATAVDTAAMLDFDQDRITVIGAGADDRFQPPTRPSTAIADDLVADGMPSGLRKGYVLFPSGIDPRKNVERALVAYGRVDPALRRRHQLVLACRLSEPDRRDVERIVAEAGIGDDFIATGYVSDDLLCRLYQGAELVVFPSLYEGFGLPALEAMSCRAPVICADSSSLREVQTIPEARFDPESEQAIADAITAALLDDEFRNTLRRQMLPQFSWDNAARLTGGVVDDLLDEARRAATRPTAPRMALFSPHPIRGPLARSLRRLLDELRHRGDVTLFVDPAHLHHPVPDGVDRQPVSRFDAIERGGGAFDHVLHLIDNSPDSIEVARSTLGRSATTVVLRGGSFTELFGAMADRYPGEVEGGSVGRLLARTHPGRYRPEVEELDRVPQATATRFGICLVAPLLSGAERVIVSSAFAASVLALDTGFEGEVPFTVPCPRVDAAVLRPLGPQLISSFGPVGRGHGLLIEALASVRNAISDVRLRLVGPIDDAVAAELRALASELGVSRGVEISGDLDDVDVTSLQKESTVAVQLHHSASDAARYTVGELLAYGVPTLVGDIGPMTELPDDAVVKLPISTSATDLADRLIALLFDDARRTELAENGHRYAKASSYPAAVASLLDYLSLPDAGRRQASRS